MGRVKKESLEQIIKLMLKDVSTEEIAKKTNYAIGTIRGVVEDLRNYYDVNSKTGVAVAWIHDELQKIKEHVNDLSELTNLSCGITTGSKTSRQRKKKRK